MTKNEWNEWKNLPTTKEILKEFTAVRDGQAEAMASGATIGEDVVQATARMVGYISGLNAFIYYEAPEEAAEPYDH